MIEATIRAHIDHWAGQTPDAPFLIEAESGRTITYGKIQGELTAFAGALAARGMQPGDSIGFAMTNGIDTARVILGCLTGGYLATAVNLVAGAQTISYVLEHSQARMIFVEDGTRALLEQATEGGQNLVTLDAAWMDQAVGPPTPNPQDDGLLMYTSGTTGRPKGVILTQAALIAGGRNAALAHELTPADRALCVLPLYHINGLCVTLMGPLISGGSVVLPPKFSVSSFWRHLRAHACSWFSVVPTQINYLLHAAVEHGHDRAGLEALRFGRSASAPLAPEVQRGFEDRFGIPIIETMGLTETAAQILSNPMPPGERKIGSPGIPFGNDVIIGDAEQRELPRGQEGEILVRGDNVMRVYRDNPQATAEALTPEGWLRTGDLGRMDADDYVFVTGRLKELIIKGGENIAPREIDEVLYSHPDVIEAAAFPRTCPQYGQRVEAGVMLRDGSNLTEAAMIALCRDAVGAFKAPDRVHVLPELPKGPSGKIQRMKLADLTDAEHVA
ncbi:MAG: AMP-binding protein [Pseudomonadota bacterium]